MLESPNSSNTTAQQQQMVASVGSGDFSEQYFASLSGPAKRLIEDVVAVRDAYEDVWNGLEVSEREQILDESIIRPEAVLKYETTSNTCRNPSSTVRLSSFGVDKVFPRLKVESGQKENTCEDTTGSQGEDLGSDCTYTYRDEHSSPWCWMTRSQQELRFESGRPDSYASDELSEQGLETLATTSPSRILNRQSLLIRQSKGNPLFAKPVQIPQIPVLNIPKKPEKMIVDNNHPPISPHRINNFVYEEDNRIVLDFGDHNNVNEDDNSPPLRASSPSSDSAKSSQGLLAKMRETRASLKKTLSSTGTLGRRKKVDNPDKSPTLSSTTHTSMSSLHSNQSKYVVKPSIAPPPPPSNISKPNTAPPPPPPSKSYNANNVMAMSINLPATRNLERKNNTANNEDGNHRSKEEADDVVKPLEEFKIDLNTGSDIPKTGFDFLDNW